MASQGHKLDPMTPAIASALLPLLRREPALAHRLACPARGASYADLDLSTAKGHAELVRRIQRVASAMCVPANGGDDQLEAHLQYKACVDRAVKDAVERIDNARKLAATPNHEG